MPREGPCLDYRLRPATPADYPAIVEIINSTSDRAITVDTLTRQDAIIPKTEPTVRLVAEAADGTILGTGNAGGGSFAAPGVFSVKARTAAPYRRQGIGGTLLAALEQFALEHGGTRFESDVRETQPEAVAWVERRGYHKEHHMFQSTLTMSSFDPAAWPDAVTKVRDQGIRFTTMQDVMIGDETLRQFFDMLWDLSGDTPDGHGGRPKVPFDVMKQSFLSDPNWDAGQVFLALDGDRWAAVASLITVKGGGMNNQFTGVDRRYRGRGLSLAIKLVALQYAKERGAAFIRTNNHSANAPMLATNRKLGYVPEPGVFKVAKSVTR